jgi:hypothetical protein
MHCKLFIKHKPTVLVAGFLPAEQHKNAEGLDPDSRKEWGYLFCIHKNGMLLVVGREPLKFKQKKNKNENEQVTQLGQVSCLDSAIYQQWCQRYLHSWAPYKKWGFDCFTIWSRRKQNTNETTLIWYNHIRQNPNLDTYNFCITYLNSRSCWTICMLLLKLQNSCKKYTYMHGERKHIKLEDIIRIAKSCNRALIGNRKQQHTNLPIDSKNLTNWTSALLFSYDK